VGKRDTEGQKAAPESKAEEKVKTTAEEAEATWSELRSSMPAEIQEAIPTWNNLTEAQKKAVIAVGAELNMRNVEQIIALPEGTRTTDVKTREVPNNERKLLGKI
jgi:hypothetical protein